MQATSNTYDVIVLGLGGVGSSAVYHLARAGYHVAGIDQFSPPHDRGSSHGRTRIIRKAYFEHPDYVPLLQRAYQLWHQLESDAGRQLFRKTGLLLVGPRDGEVLRGVKTSADRYDLPIETMDMEQAMSRFPGLVGSPSWTALLEVDAGYLHVEACIEAHLQDAECRGATLLTNESVIGWRAADNGVTVTTDRRSLRAARLICAAGPWSGEIFKNQSIPLDVWRKHLYWYKAAATYSQESGFPCFFFDTPTGYYYGFPESDGCGLKVARHSGGQVVHSLANETHQQSPEDRCAVELFLKQHLPQVEQELLHWQGCYYTMTPDQHFIVDSHPEHDSVVIVAGLSGHGFKFTSVLGELAAQLATNREPQLEIRFLSWDRFRQ
jgi:sarcosine oxidase